jgi:hypothetical protein
MLVAATSPQLARAQTGDALRELASVAMTVLAASDRDQFRPMLAMRKRSWFKVRPKAFASSVSASRSKLADRPSFSRRVRISG